MTIKEELQHLAKQWREKAARIDDKFAYLDAAQTRVATETLITCAEEVEDLCRRMIP